MFSKDIFALGLGLEAPWKIQDIKFDTEASPNRLDLRIRADRGAMYSCPECGEPCKAHDFLDMTWRHLNFFQHHCYLTASVPRVHCPKHGIHRVHVPWAREGSRFTLLSSRSSWHSFGRYVSSLLGAWVYDSAGDGRMPPKRRTNHETTHRVLA